MNQFASLPSESPESALAQMDSRELAEMDAFIDAHNASVPDPAE